MSLLPYAPHLMIFFLVSLLICMTITRSCNDVERHALLNIKANLVDKYNNLYNWGNVEKDCCQWEGVKCNDQTGHVINLSILEFSAGMSGNLSSLSSLSFLSHLEYLVLFGINFQLSPIPSSLSSLTNLWHLSFSSANLSGSIPHQLANLSNLQSFNLRDNSLSGEIPISFGNLTSLTYLDLSDNLLEGVIPNSFGDMISLTDLHLSNNLLEGAIPKSLGKFPSLVHLDLSRNHFSGSVPDFSRCPSLRKLELFRNRLTGNLPISVGTLSNLVYLDVSSNSFEGLISEDHFLNLTQLKYLDLSFNSFAFNLSSHARLPFSLKTIKLRSCKLGPGFPMWIQTQRDFSYLDISNAGISEHVPMWFWDLPYGLTFFNLSSNEIKGMLPNITSMFQWYPGMDLSNNQLEGTISMLPPRMAALNLSGNRFSGTLSFLCQIDVALTFLDLSSNFLSGGLPDCSLKFKNTIVVLNLSNNNLSGKIPSYLGFMSQLQALYLRKNAFDGEIPIALRNCTKLRFVDLGENKLSGNIPSWLGETCSELYVLVLRANKLKGSLPSKICWLSNLQYLDVSTNGLSGKIPKCFGNFTGMATREYKDDITSHSYSTFRCSKLTRCSRAYSMEDSVFIDNAVVAWKGTRREFGRGLYLLKGLDISSNKLCGELPEKITNLLGLVSLNVSNNQLRGQIPKRMGRLGSLESLDLSRNTFSGKIPLSLSQIASLSYLDLSYNNLSGRIPTGTQLQGFNYTFYRGNPRLCGPPVTPSCGLRPPPATIAEKDDDEDGDQFWKSQYTGMGAGFAVGFSGICGAFFFNCSCRKFTPRFL